MFKQIEMYLNYFRDGHMTEAQLSSVLYAIGECNIDLLED